jgi:hypothetical protein
MNYEQRYKESLARAKEQLDGAKAFDYDNEQVAHDIRTTVYNIFPELKESKSERIRKELIKFVKSHLAGFPQCEKYIAWLENQGEHKSIWHNEDEEPQKGSLILLIMQSGTPVVAKIIESNHTFNHGERWAYIDDLLESKSEQKPVDKVGPKFKDGDWVVFNGLTLYINEVVKGYYRTISKGGICNSYDWDIDNAARLWTLNEAKDGDVLVYEDYDSVKIFIYQYGKVHCYCCLTNSTFVPHSFYFGVQEDQLYRLHPAGKKQHDLLFAKMKEEGYEWNADKKELIKL